MSQAESSRVPTSSVSSSGHAPPGGWSLETAIDYLLAVGNEKHAHVLSVIAGNDRRYEERFGASQKALELGLSGQKSEISAALAAADRAVLKAEMATEKRFESVNEFRGTLDNQQRTLIPRSEVGVMVEGLNEKINNLTKQVDALVATAQGVKGGWGYAVGAVGLLLALGSLVMIGVRFVQGSP